MRSIQIRSNKKIVHSLHLPRRLDLITADRVQGTAAAAVAVLAEVGAEVEAQVLAAVEIADTTVKVVIVAVLAAILIARIMLEIKGTPKPAGKTTKAAENYQLHLTKKHRDQEGVQLVVAHLDYNFLLLSD